ncbi:MAG: hypothetical protein HC845_03535 [Akkermansiaceae bacterium]|nr:hypothetical protein [Akkermansiaceae bacterium]
MAQQIFSQIPPPSASAQWVPYLPGSNGEPGWWAGRGATNAAPINDFAALKQGQLKHFTRKTVDELNARYAGQGGAGADLTGLVNGWIQAHPDPKDQDLVKVGQLKWVANKVHARLVALGASPSVPSWMTVSSTDDRLANIGQLKTVFNFNTVPLVNLDTDGDGIPNAWEIANGLNPNVKDANVIGSDGNTHLGRYTKSLLANAGSGLATVPALTIDSEAPHQSIGAIKGTLSVAGDGSASYSIPIDIPKGTGGMEPKLSLGYSSSGGNGTMGVGWSLGGLQRITRGASSVAKDGFYDPVDFDGNDRFFLDGERLVCVAGTYGGQGSEYRTEMDSYGRITYEIGNSWKIETKAGLIVRLGQTADSKVSAGGGTLSWGVNEVSDTLGNYYNVQYTGQNVSLLGAIQQRVSRISYTGNYMLGKSPYCSIDFIYGPNERPDKSRAFTYNARYSSTLLLSKILVKTGSHANHSYTFEYENSFQTGRSFLKRLRRFANDDASTPIPPTVFNYDGIQASEGSIWGDLVDVRLPQLANEGGEDRGISFLDLDADGLTDFSTWRVTSFDENFPSPPAAGTYNLIPRSEGKAFINQGTGYGSNQGFVENNAFLPPNKLPLGVSYNAEQARKYNEKHQLTAQPMDIDGDGLLDLMGSVDMKQTIALDGSRTPYIGNRSLRNGYEFYSYVGGAWKLKNGWDLPFDIGNDPKNESYGGERRIRHFQWADLNADGYQDLVIKTTDDGKIYNKIRVCHPRQ